jgi:hypothetical protein
MAINVYRTPRLEVESIVISLFPVSNHLNSRHGGNKAAVKNCTAMPLKYL